MLLFDLEDSGFVSDLRAKLGGIGVCSARFERIGDFLIE
jgi:hypothetical protein